MGTNTKQSNQHFALERKTSGASAKQVEVGGGVICLGSLSLIVVSWKFDVLKTSIFAHLS